MHLAAKIAGCSAAGAMFGASIAGYGLMKINEGNDQPKAIPTGVGMGVGAGIGVATGLGAGAMARDAGIAMSKAGPAGIAVGLATGAAAGAMIVFGSQKMANAAN